MAKPKIKPHQKQSLIKETLASKKSKNELAESDTMLISLKHLDRTQGDSLDDWDLLEILSSAIETLVGYSGGSIRSQATTEKFTIYGDFPPSEKTDYTHPLHVPEDAEWARIHVNGKQCIIGHIVPPNTFYLVFLDGDHRFWISEKRNT